MHPQLTLDFAAPRKFCSACSRWLDFSGFVKHRSRKDGLYVFCKSCTAEKCRARTARIRARLAAEGLPNVESRVCSACLRSLPPDHFSRDSSSAGGRSIYCKACRTAQRRKAREATRAYNHAYYCANSEKNQAACRAWRKANPDRLRELTRRNNDRRRRLEGFTSEAEWKALCARCGNHCLACRKVFPFKQLTRDHVIPVTLGGSNDAGNLQPLCKSCNSSKFQQTTDYRPLWDPS